ncbi:J domain-containing protein [Synechococcus sp. PCC 7336]|uniref:J domain-containing protein n=1 Tax=Synechococcus sp. PCC 7336 TaxID=195250 RepID=UPI00034966E3|nr:J domain-containing protein [Synechococcus sp. PCC 7336]
MREPTYYDRLGVAPWASIQEIRHAYRDLSKRYHPDISPLAPDIAKQRFQGIHEAYAILTNPTQRALYDGRTGFGTVPIVQIQDPPSNGYPERAEAGRVSAASYEITRRPLSDSEQFALFTLVVTIALSLALVAFLSWSG